MIAHHAELVIELRRADKAKDTLVYFDRTGRPWISWLDAKGQRWAVSYPVKGNHFMYSDPFEGAVKIDSGSNYIRLPIHIIDSGPKPTGDRPTVPLSGSETTQGTGDRA